MVDFQAWKEALEKDHQSWFVKVTGPNERKLAQYTRIRATGLVFTAVGVLGSVS